LATKNQDLQCYELARLIEVLVVKVLVFVCLVTPDYLPCYIAIHSELMCESGAILLCLLLLIANYIVLHAFRRNGVSPYYSFTSVFLIPEVRGFKPHYVMIVLVICKGSYSFSFANIIKQF